MASNRAPVRRPRGEGLPRRWWIVLLVLFLVFDIILVVLALNSDRAPSSAGRQTPIAAPSPAPSDSVAPSPSQAATAPIAPVQRRLLSAVSADIAWRGDIGVCPDGPSALEYTADGGSTWKTVDPGPETGANTVLRLIPADASQANAVTLNADCSPQLVGTFVAGDAWEDYSSDLGSYWYVDPADRATVHSPVGPLAAPCDSVVALATRSSEAAVLCADQRIFETTAGGTEWSTAVPITGAVALTGFNEGYVVAVVGQSSCAGTSVIVMAAEGPGEARGCLGEAPPAGEVAVAAAEDGTLWVWSGENFERSTDGGMTWG